MKKKSIVFYMLTLIFFFPFLYYVYWYFGPLQIKQIEFKENHQIYGQYFGYEETYRINYINDKETVISVGLGYVDSVENYYMKSNKNKVEIYIIKGKSNSPLPYTVIVGNYKHPNEYVENYKINKKINPNNIEIYAKGLEDKDFKQIKVFNQ
ncbi:hypothetical protein [Bacillus thuringiensis]|uniref:Uncharacterized protein n=1 Tax=Bacillus thuringiensis TaxID=1428 RepID=A0A9X6WHZ3_BACTU|nr:hypothetical protein [Bacillus thuringiensis]PFJ28983.1 hypothetical protein COJ15_32465 [Bacillus thuringiensis]